MTEEEATVHMTRRGGIHNEGTQEIQDPSKSPSPDEAILQSEHLAEDLPPGQYINAHTKKVVYSKGVERLNQSILKERAGELVRVLERNLPLPIFEEILKDWREFFGLVSLVVSGQLIGAWPARGTASGLVGKTGQQRLFSR